MNLRAATELILIRHAPALADGRLCGRTDVAADCSDLGRLAAVRAHVGRWDRLLCSPALRCRQTAAALWDQPPEIAPALAEQDFGLWDGRPWADLPDLGPLSADELARHRPPEGESFAELCDRAGIALAQLATGGCVVAVAHAGTVRAALAKALGRPAPALAFEVAPLSVTRIRIAAPEAPWSVISVNWTAA